ncbi:MAG: hypothetical protein HZC47_08300 [Methanobacterium sp.]|nr:hypothetical protein [Methanobacterium sp.]
MINYFWAWILTIIIEFFILWLFIKKQTLELLLYSILINSLTLPLATYSYQNILNNIYIIELTVILLESLLIMILLQIKYKKAFLISITANTATALTGFLIFALN